MKKLKWYFNHGKDFELFSVLYKKDGWLVVKNDNTGKYSFGLSRDFGSPLGFPVNQSCLSSDEIKNVLEDYINICSRESIILSSHKIKRFKKTIYKAHFPEIPIP